MLVDMKPNPVGRIVGLALLSRRGLRKDQEQLHAKHKRMIKHQCAESPAVLLQAPAHPLSGSDMVKTLKQSLESVECPAGEELFQKRFGELLGAPKSTINDWSHGKLAEPIKRFLCGLERLTEIERSRLVHRMCRPCPRFHDPQIAHDANAVGALTAILNQPSGVTFIVGPEAARTYLITAMGNSVAWRTRACGLDVHRPDAFVPVPGVSYLAEPCSLPQLRALFRHLWPRLIDRKNTLMILNGIWGQLPEMRLRVAKSAARRHVLVADDPGLDLRRIRWRTQLNVISIEISTGDAQRFHITVQTT